MDKKVHQNLDINRFVSWGSIDIFKSPTDITRSLGTALLETNLKVTHKTAAGGSRHGEGGCFGEEKVSTEKKLLC